MQTVNSYRVGGTRPASPARLPATNPGVMCRLKVFTFKHLAVYSLVFVVAFITILFARRPLHACGRTAIVVEALQLRQSPCAADSNGANASFSSSPPSPKPSTLFLGVMSAAANTAKREAIRDTLGTHRLVQSGEIGFKVRRGEPLNLGAQGSSKLPLFPLFPSRWHTQHIIPGSPLIHATQFFIGQPAPSDGARDDVVVVPHADTYRGIARKALAIMVYGALNTSARYVLKCDDDSFVRAWEGLGISGRLFRINEHERARYHSPVVRKRV